MKPIEIKPDIYWVGVIDWAIRDFHGYAIPKGTSYNNYLIVGDDVTLLDTVKYNFAQTAIRNVADLVDPSRIRNIVINHVENDHMTSLDRFVELAPEATIYITAKGKEVVEKFFDTSGWNFQVVKTGDTLDCGKYTLHFIETPLLHWPDSMMTYVEGANLLVSQDILGQHIATAMRFDDEFIQANSRSELDDLVLEYFANIFMPYAKLVSRKIGEVRDLGVTIDMIAPDHGVIWRSDPGRVMDMWLDMAAGKAEPGVAIIYDTMWESTGIMADSIMRGIRAEGMECKVIKLRETPASLALTDLFKRRAFLLGSPTLNNEVFPPVGEFALYLKGLKIKDRMAGAFGSYGWGGGAVRWLYDQFEQMKLDAVRPGVEVKSRPTREEIEQCYEFGRDFARKVAEYHRNFT